MANTTNFNWETPDDTDLVKDGAAAIRTLGSSIDTSFVDLKGGTTGQILSKASNTDLDYTWIANQVGDITEVQAGVGISVASGTGPIPIITNSSTDLITTAGDLLYGTAADTVARLGIGTAGQVLKVNSGATAPEWGTVSGGGKILQVVQGTLTSSFTTTSTTYVDSGLSVSITPSSATSKVLIFVSGFGQVDRTGAVTSVQGQYNLVRTTTQLQSFQIGFANFASSSAPEINAPLNASYLDSPSTTSATTYKVQAKSDTSSTTTTRIIASATQIASIVAMEVGV